MAPKLEHDERSLADLVTSFSLSSEQLLVDRETRQAAVVALRSLSPRQQTVLAAGIGKFDGFDDFCSHESILHGDLERQPDRAGTVRAAKSNEHLNVQWINQRA